MKTLFSLVSRGARLQFEIAVAMISIIPLLVMAYFMNTGVLVLSTESGWVKFTFLVLVGLVCLGHALVGKYPITIIRLRRYLQDIVNGEIPDKVNLMRFEDDVSAIEDSVNLILGELRKRVETVTQEKARLEKQLCQGQKLKSMGMIAAGVAHEINTPLQFIGDNTRFLAVAAERLSKLVDTYRGLLSECDKGVKTNKAMEMAQKAEKEVDLKFLNDEISSASRQSYEGLESVDKVVRAMKDFSHISNSDDKVQADINKAIEGAATLSRSEWKYFAEMKMDLDPDLDPVLCHLGDIKQVLINLVINAAHAVESAACGNGGRKGMISISTRRDNDDAVISIRDTGIGIPEDIKDRIFDQFFTTKQEGKGTGQGLSMAWSVVVGKHGGRISHESAQGGGTVFTMRIPFGQEEKKDAKAKDVSHNVILNNTPVRGGSRRIQLPADVGNLELSHA
jgi:signal transduction histidine kinase